MYQLHRLRGLGLRVRVFEAGDGVGGTWYWNRYPGARFDSESWTYRLLLLRRDPARVEWSEHSRRSRDPALLQTSSPTSSISAVTSSSIAGSRSPPMTRPSTSGRSRARTAGGRGAVPDHRDRAALGTPTMPTIPGVESFRGEAYHTGRWPHEPVSFVGKRVAVIGTGATPSRRSPRSPRPSATSRCSSAHRTGARPAQQQDRRGVAGAHQGDVSGDLRALP